MQKRVNKQLLSLCILASVCLHGLSLYFFQSRSIWLSGRTALSPLAEKALPKNQVLKEAFSALSKGPEVKGKPSKVSQELPMAPFQIDESDPDLVVFQMPSSFHQNKLVTANDAVAMKPPFKSSLSLDLEVPKLKAQKDRTHLSMPREAYEPALIFTKTGEPRVVMAEAPLAAYDGSVARGAAVGLAQGEARRPLLNIPAPSLLSFPTLDELDTSSYSDAFDLDFVCAPRSDQPGFLFALTLIPRPDLQLPKLHQHYMFLIDRANSIQRERLLVSKTAVLKALDFLAPDDTFNIVVFDSKIEKLFPADRPPDIASKSMAKSFLDKINLGSFFSPADLYNPLALTLPEQVADNETYTAILLTDGENLAKKSAMRAVLQHWTWQNNGNVALFTVAMGSDAQLAALDVASAFNKGRLYYSPTKRGIRRKMFKLMKNIQTPLAKNVSCRGIGKGQNQKIALLPRSQQTPQLYLDQPFVIIGSCDSMDDFIFFLQGRLKDRWLNIKKTISFVNAKKGGGSLKKEYALQLAYQYYERYVHDDNPEHLAKARELLQPFDIQTAFQ